MPTQRRENPGIFRISKRTPGSIRRRKLDLGAHINLENNLEIYRGPQDRYLKASDNKCLVLRQADGDNNPEVLEIVNHGSGDAIVQRAELGSSTKLGHLTKAGVWTDTSDEKLKKNFKNMSDEKAEKVLENLQPKSFTYKADESRDFGPTAQNFKSATGLGDGVSIGGRTLAGIAVRLIQFIWARHKALEAQVAALNQPTQTEQTEG